MGGVMSVAELLAELERLGIRLEVDRDRLRYFRRPDLAARLKAHKGAILAALWSRPGARQLFPTFGLEALRAAQVRRVDDDEHPESCNPYGPDGWPVDTVDPDDVRPCAKCGGLELWQDICAAAGTVRSVIR